MKQSKSSPPNLATKFLLLFLKDELGEEVLGDLNENFRQVVKEKSLWRAKLNYWFQVLNYLRPFALRKIAGLNFHSMSMIHNYFVISRRTLLKQKLYAFINITGLSIGLACFLIIMLFVQQEFSYNLFYNNGEQIYRVYQKQIGNTFMGTDYFSVTPGKLAAVMREEFPEVAYATSLEESSGLLGFENEHYYEQGLAGDSQFFQVLPMEFIEGSAATALRDPQAIVLTKSLAKKIFQDKDPIGQLVSYQERDGFKVSAIIEDPPASSSLQYSFVVNIMYNDHWRDEMARAGWSGNSFHTFFVLARGAEPRALEKKFPALLNKYRNPADYKDYPFQDIYIVQPITEIYFQSGINFDIGLKGNLKVVYSFLAAAIIVLLLACVNYMNLAIARSIKRSKEVGIRKVSGAFKHQIVFQFLSESVLIAVISLLLAVGLTYVLLPYFSVIMERPLEFNILSNPYLLPGLLAVVVVVGFLSGSYPAFVMSSLRPIEVLKVKAHVALSGIGLQRSLVVIQFAASVTLVVVSLLIYMQLKFVREKDLGYDKQNVVTMRLKDFSLRDKFPTLFNEWIQNPNVVSATLTSHLPTHITSSSILKKSSADLDKDGLAIYQWVAEYHFMDVFGLELLSGRSFSKDIKTDIEQACIINETAAKALGWSASEAIGQEVYRGAPIKIIGVIKDFHMHSMHLPIQPLMVRVAENRGNVFSVKIKPTNTAQTIAFLENVVRKISSYPFQYEFLDDNYNQLYKSETKLGEIFGAFTFISILIASLGLFGLAAFIGEQRTKEIGIRKVLGASVNSIVFLLSKGLMKLVVIAIIVAIPISWYIIQLWLQDFAYRIEIQWWIFAVAGLLALLVANISIGYQSWKASFVNPVDSLRSE